MDRPRCGTCPHFDRLPGSAVRGACRFARPRLAPVQAPDGALLTLPLVYEVEVGWPGCADHPEMGPFLEFWRATVRADQIKNQCSA